MKWNGLARILSSPEPPARDNFFAALPPEMPGPCVLRAFMEDTTEAIKELHREMCKAGVVDRRETDRRGASERDKETSAGD